MMIDPFVILIIVIFAVVTLYLRRPAGPVVRGARGERRVRNRIASGLDADEYHQFHDVTLPTPDGSTQIDQIIVSCYGIFVVETKNYKGWIFGDARSKQWTQTLYRKKYRFQNPLRQNYKHVKAVESFLGLKSRFVHSVIVFVGNSEFRTTLPANVTHLRGFIPYVRSKSDPLLSERRVASIRQMLADHKSGTADVQKKVPTLKVVSLNPLCPRCGSEMVMRTAGKGRNAGNRFWGCSRFPKCRTVKDIL